VSFQSSLRLHMIKVTLAVYVRYLCMCTQWRIMFALLSPLCVFGSSILRRKLAFITVVILPLFHTSCTILWNFEIKCPFQSTFVLMFVYCFSFCPLFLVLFLHLFWVNVSSLSYSAQSSNHIVTCEDPSTTMTVLLGIRQVVFLNQLLMQLFITDTL